MTAVVQTPQEATDEIAPYLTAVRAALAGASAAQRDELLDDLAGHLAELAAEPDAPPLVDRLGPPDVYAAELVASTGIDVGASPTPRVRRLETVADVVRGWWSLPGAVATREFLPELRPGWWVLRGYVAVGALAHAGSSDHAALPFPELGGNALLGLVAVAVLVPLSVALGRSGRRRWDRLATAVGVVAVLVVLPSIDEPQRANDAVYGPYYPGGLVGREGQQITNIWPYDGEGNPIDGVYLFDDAGRPIDVGPTGHESPGAVVVPGLYPQSQVTYDFDERTGTERPVPATAPSVSIPRLPTTTTTTTTATTATTTTTLPTAPPATEAAPTGP